MVNIVDYKELVVGDRVINPGNSKEFKTGDWRSKVPVVDSSNCIDCLTCWIYCPDDCVIVEDGKLMGFKLSHCKGCGICAQVCPRHTITMKEEEDE